MEFASWRSLGFLTHALILASMSQVVAPSMRGMAAMGFALAVLIFMWGLRSRESVIPPRPGGDGSLPIPFIAHRGIRIAYLVTAVCLLVFAYHAFAGNHFTTRGVVFWLSGLLCFVLAVWQRDGGDSEIAVGSAATRFRPSWTGIALIGVILLAVFFRFHHLDLTPIEMTSDHAEKLYDVNDVLNGQRPIFFPRNTGREAVQFYVTALLIEFTPLELSHLALKVGTGLFGVMGVFFTYLLGREFYNRHIGLLAAALMAMGHWHVAITRVGLRFPFTAAFATPVLYFLFRAFRLNRRRDWILVGVFLGVGLHTYIPMRIVPLLLVLLCAVKFVTDFFARRSGRTPRPTSLQPGFWLNAVIGAVTSLILFLPLLRYMRDEPAMFWMRAASRATSTELTLSETLEVFIRNLKNAALMFSYIGDTVAVNTIGGSPLLGWLTGALFVLGLGYLLLTLVRDRDLRPIYLMVVLFTLVLPSTLSIEFPDENPSVVRTGGAPPVVMIIAALPLYWWARVARRAGQGLSPTFGKALPAVGVSAVLVGCFVYNYNWYFVRYHDQILGAIWNTRDIGGVIRKWVSAGGDMDNAYQIGYPHWVDTRLIAIHAGDIRWHNVAWQIPPAIKSYRPTERSLFLLHPDDTEHVKMLEKLHPDGRWVRDPSSTPDRSKDFVIFEVPAASPDGAASGRFLVISGDRWIRPDDPPEE